MVQTSTGIDSVLEELEKLEIQSGLTVPDDVKLGLRFLKMFTCCLKKCEETAGKDINLASLMIRAEAILHEAGLCTVINDSKVGKKKEKKKKKKKKKKVEDLDSVVSCLQEKVERIKPEIKEICAVLLDSSLQSKSCSSDEILEFLDCLIGNLKDLVNLRADIAVSVKKQIMVLEEKLSFLRNLVDFTAKRCTEHQKLEVFLDYVKDWVHKAACLSLLCWNDGKDEKVAQKLETMLSDLMQKIQPSTPEVAEMFVGVLKASKSSRSDKLLFSQIVVGLVDFLLEDLVDFVKDYVEILREELIFMIIFFMDPPEVSVTNPGDGIFTQINRVITEVISLISSLYMDALKVDISMERKINLSSLQYKIEKVKAEAGELYVQAPSSSDFYFPMTNGMRFIDFFLENLKEMLQYNPSRILFAKHQVGIVQEELLSLKPFLKDIMELQNENEELKDLWKRILNVVYQAEHVINSCSIIDDPVWYDILRLSNVIEAIKLIEIEVKKVNDQICNTKLTRMQTNSSHLLLPMQGNTSKLEDVVVGLKDESVTIIDRLTRGTTQLDIISIVGMPGLGKTTLAKKVYNDPAVKYYFNRCAWCCVSQVYRTRDLMLDILTDLDGFNARLSDSNTKDEDLAEKLWKGLKGRRYIIVMDDIWDIGAWDSIKGLFPDDNMGSRIMFTSRIHNLVSQAKDNCSPHPLRPLSDEESWELLREKIFQKDCCPPELSEVGENIAKNCKGLPLAVVLVAGVLAKTSKRVEWWKEIEESTGSQIAVEGCMDVLELSYKHLPDSLKSCFLYFGSFPEDNVIRVRKLMNLWIAEGLIPRTDKKSLYEVAEDYLIDLIGRSLVILTERSSRGRLKACRVHDLLRDLCLAKIQEDKFLQWLHKDEVSHSSLNPKRYDIYRLCIDGEWTQFVDSKPAGPFVHSLILFGNYQGSQSYPNPSAFFNSFKLLNVLDLECIVFDCSFPEEITLIVHLRYLSVWCQAKELPSSIANLKYLEILIVRASASEISLPNAFWQMKSLRHVHIPSMVLIGLEHHEDCELQNMDIFSSPILNSGKETEELLRRLPGLRKLKCRFIERQFNNKPYKFPELSRLKGLESLKVYSYGPVFFGDKSDQFPAFDFPNTLTRLTLGRFSVPWRAISIIGQLPNLEVLKLQERAFSGKRWDTEDGEFLKLKFLELWQLNIEQWSIPDDEPFPCLEQLVVKNCYSLEEIPSSLGYIPTLKKIEMRWCFEASNSARQILEEQRDMGNDGLEVIVFA